MGLISEENKALEQRMRDTRKLILIENLDNLNLTPKKKKEFIKYYYSNLDIGLEEALDEFKKLK